MPAIGTPISAAERAKIPDAQEGVEYRRHPVYDDYVVGSDGSVYSTIKQWRKPRETFYRIAGIPDKDGYLQMSMRQLGFFQRAKFHLLVLETFVGPRPEGLWGLHLNDKPSDNRLSNLMWGTAKTNTQQRISNGSPLAEVHNPACRLTEEQVREIRALVVRRGQTKNLCAEYKISVPLFQKIRNRSVWKSLV